MRFARPELLWLLLVAVPTLCWFFWWAMRQRQALMSRFVDARHLPSLMVGISPQRRRLKMGTLILAVCFVIGALARPQWGFVWEEASLRGVDIIVAIDTSKSMLTEDIAPNRLVRAKLAALDLLRLAKTDRLGLVAFAGTAFLQCPLTIDESAFRQCLDMLDVNTLPQGGTALAEAIEAARAAFKERDSYKVLLLLSDGEDHEPGALEAAQEAAKDEITIYSIGMGTTEGDVIRLKDEGGRTEYLKDADGTVIKSRLNEELLREIASATTGGIYLPLRGANTIETLYNEVIAKLPKTERQERLVKRYHERFHWPLAIALALLMFEMLLPDRKSDRKGERSAGARPAGSLRATAVTLACLLMIPAFAFASPRSALRDYEAGRYEEALRQYEQLLRKKKDDARLHYNAGAAAYRNGQFDEAARLFSEALTAPDLELQESAYYNRGNAHYYSGEQDPDPAQRSEKWKKALQDFQSSLKLNGEDSNAQFNHDFVKQRLEELQQQQQQQQQQNQEQQNQDQQNQDQPQERQNPQQQQSQQNKEQQQGQDQQQQQQQQQQAGEQQQPPDQQSPGQQEQQQQQQQQEEQNPEQQGQQQSPAQREKKDGQEQGQAYKAGTEEPADEVQAPVPGGMTPREARQLLDSQKGEEKMLPAPKSPAERNRRFKDW